jgi:hypothetical protein
MMFLSTGGIILVDVQSISKEIDGDLLKIETEVESLEDYAMEIRKLKTMSISEAIVVIKEINLNEFSLHYLRLCKLGSVIAQNLQLIREANPEDEIIKKTKEKLVDLLNRGANATSAKEEMQKYYEDIINEIESLK